MLGAIVIGAVAGIQEGYGFGQFFVRLLIMLLLLKAYDILFFDWVLLCNAGFNFFPHFYPETKEVLGRHLFGYNKKTHNSFSVYFSDNSMDMHFILSHIQGDNGYVIYVQILTKNV